MAHFRDRSYNKLITKDLSYSPAVGLVGIRQVGKTTLLKKYASDYLSFDAPQTAIDFERNGAHILGQTKRTLALDEVQKFPPVFDMLKHAIDTQKKPGRFLVSGSVRFASRKAIRESLTGRIVTIEIYPFTLAECHNQEESVFLSTIKDKQGKQVFNQIRCRSIFNENDLVNYMQTGGLPGICFRRDEAIRNRLMQSHLDTLLARDIHLVRNFDISLDKMLTLVTEIAKNQGQNISYANYARLAGISMPTMKSLFLALEALFLIRPFGKTYFIEDAGISHYLSSQTKKLTYWDKIRLLYYHFRVQIAAKLNYQAKMQPYSTRGGLFVPFVIDFHGSKKLAIFIDESDIPSNRNIKSAAWFKKYFPDAQVVILIDAKAPFETENGIWCLPWLWVF